MGVGVFMKAMDGAEIPQHFLVTLTMYFDLGAP